ncbi:MAG: PorV/PorQ family protein [Balneolaceae bacterium]
MKSVLFTVVLLLMSFTLFAQNRGTGFEMLNISPTSYSLSRAEATVSVPEGAASLHINPALLALNTSSSVDLGYSFWIEDVSNIFGGVNFKNDRHAIAFSFYSSGADDYEQRNTPSPEPNGTFSIQNLAIGAAYAYDFEYFSLGGAVQYLNESIYTYRASGYAFNMGIASQFLDGRIRTGASISNIGEMEELDVEATTLPTNFRAGASADLFEVTAPKNNELPILVSAYLDYMYPLSDNENTDLSDYRTSDPYFSLGLGFNIAEVVELSGGYKFKIEDILNREFEGYTERPFAFGASFIADNIKFDYALVPFSGWGTVHSIGIQYKF